MRGSWDRECDPLAALSAGDPTVYEDFVRQEIGTFLGFFQRMGADLQEAEDLTQEVFLKLFQHARRYRPDERFTAFAFRVARNAWVDRSRRRAVRGAGRASGDPSSDGLELLQKDEGSSDVLEACAQGEEARSLLSALAGLSEAHRSVFELGAMQALSYAEVSDLLGIPVGTVKSRMFHALRRLREVLERTRAEEPSA